MPRNLVWLTRTAAAATLALALSVLSGCGDDGLGPIEIDIDPGDAANTLGAVIDQFVENNEAVQSVDVFTEAIFNALGVSPAVVAAIDALPGQGEGAFYGLARNVQERFELAAGTDLAAGIPAAAQVTWVYVTGAGYQIDDQRTTPPNTARFILYTVDPVSETPVIPLEEIGYLDLTDTSQGQSVQIGLTAVIQGVTLIDVAVTGVFDPQSSLDLDFDGFLSDGTDQLDITLGVNVTAAVSAINFSLGLGDLTGNFTFTRNNDDSGSFRVSFSDGTDTIEFRINLQLELIGDEFIDTITGGSGVRYNGRTVAIVTGTLDNPTVTNAAGDPLTTEEVQALGNLLDGSIILFLAYDRILAFALLLLLLA